VLAFNFVLAIGVSLLFALAPALQFWKPDLVSQMKEQSAASTGGRLTFRRATVALQIGLSLLLLACSGLFVRTLHNLRNVNVGFATDHLITFGLEPNLAGYGKDAVLPVHQRVLERLAALPGVASVGATDDPELADDGESGNISVQGYTPKEGENMDAQRPSVTPDYFATLNVPLMAGRAFTRADDASRSPVAIVNETLAKRFFGSPRNAIGRKLANGGGKDLKYDIEIVGVARDYIHRNMRGSVKMAVYHPAAQNSNPAGMHY